MQIAVDDQGRDEQRAEVLWKLAYAFLRLDQLPSGGWSRSLPEWMEALWEGDGGSITRHPEMRVTGGTDLTCYSAYHVAQFLRAHQGSEQLDAIDQAHLVLAAKIGDGKGIEFTSQAPRPPHIRHTLMGLLLFITYEWYYSNTQIAEREIHGLTGYLRETISQWHKDRSHPFAMYAAAVKVAELLRIPASAHPPASDREALLKEISACGFDMMNSLLSAQQFDPKPTSGPNHVAPFFIPYGGFWRMARSNFAMYFPFLVSQDGLSFSSISGGASDGLLRRCADCLKELLKDVRVPFAADNPAESLLRYYSVGGSNQKPPRDWGLSAEFASILHFPATTHLLLQHGVDGTELAKKKEAIGKGLLHTFDCFGVNPGIFKFTHGSSFGRYLGLVEPGTVTRQRLQELDDWITDCSANGMTERALDELTSKIIADKIGAGIRCAGVREMLVAKLQAGEHTPNRTHCGPHQWSQLVNRATTQDMVGFYNGPRGRIYAERYGKAAVEQFVIRCDELTGRSGLAKRRAIDIGCGPGQYAKLLRDRGFDVDLVDNSIQMLEFTADRLGVPAPQHKDIYALNPDDGRARYDLVFACAIMVHVPKALVKTVIKEFYELLRPGGILFVNFKVRDHSLIALDGRFFEYYRDDREPRDILNAAGFDEVEINFQWNERNMYSDPKKIHWVNIFCRKPGSFQGLPREGENEQADVTGEQRGRSVVQRSYAVGAGSLPVGSGMPIDEAKRRAISIIHRVGWMGTQKVMAREIGCSIGTLNKLVNKTNSDGSPNAHYTPEIAEAELAFKVLGAHRGGRRGNRLAGPVQDSTPSNELTPDRQASLKEIQAKLANCAREDLIRMLARLTYSEETQLAEKLKSIPDELLRRYACELSLSEE
jgi:SAM-dependent methyltransferase